MQAQSGTIGVETNDASCFFSMKHGVQRATGAVLRAWIARVRRSGIASAKQRHRTMKADTNCFAARKKRVCFLD